jgi:hypothetical protein
MVSKVQIQAAYLLVVVLTPRPLWKISGILSA